MSNERLGMKKMQFFSKQRETPKEQEKTVEPSVEEKPVHKNFFIDRVLNQRLRKYAFDHEMKEVQVARDALDLFLSERGY